MDDLEKTRVELQNSKRQCELMKSLLENATSENDIMFEVLMTSIFGLHFIDDAAGLQRRVGRHV
jgi:protein ECT2